MSSLRKLATKGADVPKGNIEAPIAKGSLAKGFTSAPRGAHYNYNPIFLTKAIFHKVLDLLFSTHDEDFTKPDGIITLLRDILIGVMFGVMILSFMIFLDHHTFVDFQSAHHFRNSALKLLNDPETTQGIEDSSNLKFMTVSDYESKRKVIDGAEATITSYNEILQKRTKEIEQMKKEMDSIKAEYENLYGNPLLGLDAYCGVCVWGIADVRALSCDQRVQFMQRVYFTRLITAKISAMEHPSCEGTEEPEITEKLDAYCGACIWAGEKTCNQRVVFLQRAYNTGLTAAMINAMEHASCISISK